MQVYVSNFHLFVFLAAILEKGLLPLEKKMTLPTSNVQALGLCGHSRVTFFPFTNITRSNVPPLAVGEGLEGKTKNPSYLK